MIIFDLICNNGHRFEGWFQSADSFDVQLAGELVSCPVCASVEVRRVPSAVHVGKGSGEGDRIAKDTQPEKGSAATPNGATTVVVNPQSELLNAYRRLVSTILANSEDVGQDFAKEARRMHYLETPARSIRGQASDTEFEALREEGIEVLKLPLPAKENLN